MSKNKNTVEQGIQYANDIIDGKIISNKYIKLACKRFLKQLDDESSDYYFNEGIATRVLSFFNDHIKHTKGDLARQPYILSDWEVWILINIFGFVSKKDHVTRKHKNVILFVARKNSKSTLTAGICLYHMIYDKTIGAEVYSIATKRDQAKIVWNIATSMIHLMDPKMAINFKPTIYEIRVEKLGSIFKPLTKESKGLDGLNVSLAIFDESACITDRNVHEVITTSQGSRTQYLNIHTTTAQTNKTTVFYENYEYCKNILTGKVKNDDSWFSAIYEIEEDDEWDDPSCWIKANPNLEKSVHTDFLIRSMKQAVELPSKKSNFLIKHLNRWTSSAMAWLPHEIWERNEIDQIKRDGDLWIGVDLGSTSDLTALTFLYRDKEEKTYYFETKCFVPEEAVKKLPRRHVYIYEKGLKEGVLMETEGDVTNFRDIKKYLINAIQGKNLKEICYDPYNARTFSTELAEDGYRMIAVRQNMENLSPATKDLEIHLKKGEIKHEPSDFVTWQFNNCSVYIDVNGNIKVRKSDDESLKIDSFTALILAMNRASANGGLDDEKKKFNITFFPKKNKNKENKEEKEVSL